MAIIYNWNIRELIVEKLKKGQRNVITHVKWQLIATDDIDNIEERISGTTMFQDPDPLNFIEYENLTEQDVVSWIEQEMTSGEQDRLQYKKDILTQKISNKKDPVVVRQKPPWAADQQNSDNNP